MPAPADCIFCRIAAGTAPGHVVFEDDRVLAFMDLFPVASGHTLVVPRTHCRDLFDASEEDLRHLVAVSKRVAHAIREVVRPGGLGVFQLNGAPAGQTVFHYHMHLIPRSGGDSFALHGRREAPAEELAEMAGRLAAALPPP